MRMTALMIAFSLTAGPVLAQTKESPLPQRLDAPVVDNKAVKPVADIKDGWETGGKLYTTKQQCLDAKKKAEKKGAIIGAVVGGGGAALLGGNFGKSALAAGAGALIGSQVGKSGKKC